MLTLFKHDQADYFVELLKKNNNRLGINNKGVKRAIRQLVYSTICTPIKGYQELPEY